MTQREAIKRGQRALGKSRSGHNLANEPTGIMMKLGYFGRKIWISIDSRLEKESDKILLKCTIFLKPGTK